MEFKGGEIFSFHTITGYIFHFKIKFRKGMKLKNLQCLTNPQEASEAIPALSSTLIPLTQRLGPLLTSLGASKSLQLPVSIKPFFKLLPEYSSKFPCHFDFFSFRWL